MRGLIYQRHDIDTDTKINVFDAHKSDFAANEDEMFIVECDTHGNYVATLTRADADDRAVEPIAWCNECFEQSLK